jgi:purine nucleosidase
MQRLPTDADALGNGQGLAHSEKVKVLLDTDIGTDIDDAVCLAYLLLQGRCDLLGITTVTGQALDRARLASVLCRAAGKDVPIYPGAEHPLYVPLKQEHAQQREALKRWGHQDRFPRGEAVEFLRSTIRAHPGEVVLLTIAPLTNIGLLFSVDPEIPSLLKAMVMMCGRFFDPVPSGYTPVEWNALGDPHATAIVYRAPVARHRSIGTDVTHRVSMSPEEFRRAFKGIPLFEPVMDFSQYWFKDWPGTTYHDPLAAAVIFEESLCRFERGNVQVNAAGGEMDGLTTMSESGPGGRHEVARDVDPKRFFDHFLSVAHGGKSL